MDMANNVDSHKRPDYCSSGQPTSQLEDAPSRKKTKVRKINGRITAASYLNIANVDFIFNIDGAEEVVPAPKSMLAFHSPVFKQWFYGESKEKEDIKMTETTIDAFVDFMQCLYEYELKIEGSQSKIAPLLALAHTYEVNWLKKECQKILDRIIDYDMNAILWVLPLAKLYS